VPALVLRYMNKRRIRGRHSASSSHHNCSYIYMHCKRLCAALLSHDRIIVCLWVD
jgi:hypothetical protein